MNLFDKFNITKEEMNKALDKWMEKMKKEEQENQLFIKERQDEVMELVYQHLKKHEIADDEEIAYFPEKYLFTREEFGLLFDNLVGFCKKQNKVNSDEDCMFPNSNFYLKFKNLNIEINMMSGQGTVFWMRISEEKSWKEELSFTYEEYKNSLNC